ncbi:MAG: DNA gyrase inhibitor YacG [Acidobacteria bacterium]|nr:DNA gyrase inhibitor YacG [Acidobacteriota bacterium]
MKCPNCKKEVPFGAPHMPFCSERCQLLDLGAWASEEYVISTPASTQATHRQGGASAEDAPMDELE